MPRSTDQEALTSPGLGLLLMWKIKPLKVILVKIVSHLMPPATALWELTLVHDKGDGWWRDIISYLACFPHHTWLRTSVFLAIFKVRRGMVTGDWAQSWGFVQDETGTVLIGRGARSGQVPAQLQGTKRSKSGRKGREYLPRKADWVPPPPSPYAPPN